MKPMHKLSDNKNTMNLTEMGGGNDTNNKDVEIDDRMKKMH